MSASEAVALTAVAAPFGAVIGSFLNVVIHRLPLGQSLATPGSHCPACEHRVRPYDNVPVLSWLFLRGRCRDCGARISPRYPLVELLTAAAFAAVALAHGLDSDLWALLPFAAMLVAVAGIDLDHRIVPNRILLPAAAWGLGMAVAFRSDIISELVIAGVGAFAFLLLAALAYPGGMGMGDVKLAGVMGLYLGLSVVPALFIAFLSGSVVGIATMARDGAGARKRALPFAPFLALGGLVGVIAGPELVELYADRFL